MPRFAAARSSSTHPSSRSTRSSCEETRGCRRPGSSELLAGLMGQNIIAADLDGWRQELERSPWIRAAALRRSLPSTVEVAIVEREPIGIARILDQLFLIDDLGVAIDRHGPESSDFDLPLVDGLSTTTPVRKTAARALAVGLPGTPERRRSTASGPGWLPG